MSSLKTYINNLFEPIRPLKPGMFHYISPPENPRNYRLHLRLEEDFTGILIVNGSIILHLNQTASEYAYCLVLGKNADQAGKYIAGRYNLEKAAARQAFLDFTERIDRLLNTPDLDPVTFLGFDRKKPFQGTISAPYRLDCALTYRLPESSVVGAQPSQVLPAPAGSGQSEAAHADANQAQATPNVAGQAEAAPVERIRRELSTQEWKTVFDRAWKAGIPHLIFTGGEPTLRDDLTELISHAEANGQITGLLTDGLRLADNAYLDSLLKTGLDHILMVLRPEIPASWTAVDNILSGDIFLAVHLTVLEGNLAEVKALMTKLCEIGLKAVSLSANDPELKEDLLQARKHAATLQLELVWNLPVPYSILHPVWMELGNPPVEAVGKAWLYVEPDGDVLPGQGVVQVLGNLLTDPWEKIWKP